MGSNCAVCRYDLKRIGSGLRRGTVPEEAFFMTDLKTDLKMLLLTATLALSGAALAQLSPMPDTSTPTETTPTETTPTETTLPGDTATPADSSAQTTTMQTGQQAAQLAAEARDLMRQARAASGGKASIDQPLWKQAAQKVEEAVLAAPNHPEVLKLRAQIYTEVGFWKQAESSWKAYFAAAPVAAGDNEARAAGQVQYNLGYAAYRRGQLPQAGAYFAACQTLDPQSAACATWAARSALESGDYAKAQALYTQALSLAPTDKSLNYFAMISRNAGTYGPEATRAFSQAYASLEAGNRADALAQFQLAARSAPAFAEAQRETGRLALEMGQLDAALTAYQALTGLPTATASDRYNFGLVQEGKQYGLKAVQTFRTAYSKYAAGDKAGAEAGFVQATAENPNYPKAWSWLGRLRYEARNYAGAIEAYSRAVALDPNDRSSAYYLHLAQQGK